MEPYEGRRWPAYSGKWKAGWESAGDTYHQFFENGTEAYTFLRACLNWALDDCWSEELFRAAMIVSNTNPINIVATRSEYVVNDTTYYMEPYRDE